MRLVLDEHLDPAIAVELRRRGHDVLAVTEVPMLVGTKDPDLLDWASGAGRVVVTYDVRGFGPQSEERAVLGESFAGAIFLSSKRYPQRPETLGALLRDLAKLLEDHPAPDALRGRSIWLASG